MAEAVIVDAVRTPVGKRRGALPGGVHDHRPRLRIVPAGRA